MTAYAGRFVLKNSLVKFGSTDFTNQCTKAVLIPDLNVQTMRTLVPDGQVVDIDSPMWTLELSGMQDWETGGLAAFMNTNQGTLVVVTIAPVNASTKKQAAISAIIMPLRFGGVQGELSQFDVSLPCQGQPTFSALP